MKRTIVIILLALALLFVLAGIGAVLFFTFDGRNMVFNQSLVQATQEESKTLNTDGPITLDVRDDAGSVTVTGGEDDQVTVKVVKTGSAPTQAGAERDLQNINYEIKQTGDTISLIYDINTTSINDQVDTVDFIVTVPTETTVNVNNGFGEVSVSDTDGDMDIENSFGAVTVQNIQGALTVVTQSGQVHAVSVNGGDGDILLSSGFGNVLLEKASGREIRLESQSGMLEMNDVRASGPVEMVTDFGDADFNTGSADELTIETKSGQVTLNRLNVQGLVTVKDDFGTIELEQVNADAYDLETNSGSVTVDGAQGNVKAHSGFGSVMLINAENVTIDLSTQSGSVDFEGSLGEGPHSVHSDFGEIILSLPADSALDVDLLTDFGTIKSDIPITVILSGETEKNRQTGTINDGGAQLTVETGSGGITIRSSQ